MITLIMKLNKHFLPLILFITLQTMISEHVTAQNSVNKSIEFQSRSFATRKVDFSELSGPNVLKKMKLGFSAEDKLNQQELTRVTDSLLAEYDKHWFSTVLYQSVGGFVGSALISVLAVKALNSGDGLAEAAGAAIIGIGAYAIIRPLFTTLLGNSKELKGSFFKTFLVFNGTIILGLALSAGTVDSNLVLPALILTEFTATYLSIRTHYSSLKLRPEYIQKINLSISPSVLKDKQGNLAMGVSLGMGF